MAFWRWTTDQDVTEADLDLGDIMMRLVRNFTYGVGLRDYFICDSVAEKSS